MFYLTWEAVDNPIAGLVAMICLALGCVLLRTVIVCVRPSDPSSSLCTTIWKTCLYHGVAMGLSIGGGVLGGEMECGIGILLNQRAKEAMEVLVFVFATIISIGLYVTHDHSFLRKIRNGAMSSANTRVKRWCGNVLANVSARVGFVPSNNSSDVVNANVGNSNTFADAKSLSLAPSKYNPVALSAWENDPGDESKKSAVDEADEAVELQSISQPDAFRASDLNEDSPRRALTGSPSNDQNPTGSINSNLIDNRVSQEHTQLVDVEVTRDVDVDKDEYMSHVTYWVPNILKSVTKRGFAIICLSVLSSVAIVFFYWMIAAITWYVHTILLERRSCVVGSNGLPDLNLNSKITISGSSAGGDMAVFHPNLNYEK